MKRETTKEPIWIRERKPADPPATPLLPVLWMREWGENRRQEFHHLAGWPKRLLCRVREEQESVPIDVVLMRYRLLMLVFSVWIFKR